MNYIGAKKLCEKILKEEIEKYDLNIKSYSFGKLSYYNSDYFKEEFNKLKKGGLRII